MTAAPIWALIPVKPFTLAKSRLARALDASERAAFARSMLEHVLRVTTGSDALAGVMVVTPDTEVASVALAAGASVMADKNGPALAAIIDAGLEELEGRGAAGALVL